MSVLILLLIASLSVSVIFLFAFIWSTKNKQFDDEYASSMRILFDDPVQTADETKKAPEQTKTFSESDIKHSIQHLN
jgi:cbb3-type cytochrome oxidase maturation protein